MKFSFYLLSVFSIYSLQMQTSAYADDIDTYFPSSYNKSSDSKSSPQAIEGENSKAISVNYPNDNNDPIIQALNDEGAKMAITNEQETFFTKLREENINNQCSASALQNAVNPPGFVPSSSDQNICDSSGQLMYKVRCDKNNKHCERVW